MKRLIRDIIIIFSYLTSLPFFRRLFLAKPVLRVWCLHEVKEHQVEEFERKMGYLKSHFNIITPEQFKKNELSKAKLNILITFDDGFDSWFKNVLPILKKYGIKAVFFINNGFFSNSERLMAEGHSLGGHGFSHKRLAEISEEELEREVWQSFRTEFFAYPYGDKRSFNKKVVNEVKKAGFKYAFGILPGFNLQKTNLYLLHRDSLDSDTPDLIFRLWLKGCYDWFKTIF